jgi:hypothetical protein
MIIGAWLLLYFEKKNSFYEVRPWLRYTCLHQRLRPTCFERGTKVHLIYSGRGDKFLNW